MIDVEKTLKPHIYVENSWKQLLRLYLSRLWVHVSRCRVFKKPRLTENLETVQNQLDLKMGALHDSMITSVDNNIEEFKRD